MSERQQGQDLGLPPPDASQVEQGGRAERPLTPQPIYTSALQKGLYLKPKGIKTAKNLGAVSVTTGGQQGNLDPRGEPFPCAIQPVLRASV